MSRALGVLLLAAALAASARAGDLPAPLRDVAFAQRLGARVPLDAPFRDEAGRAVTLRAYLDKPVVLVPAYYTCPMLCGLVQGGLVRALRAVPFTVGREFAVVFYSFDPNDRPATAAAKKAAALDAYGSRDTAAGWHFLSGDPEVIAALDAAIGFRPAPDPAHGDWAHAAGIVVLTPDGHVARYFFGVEFVPRDLRLGLVEASANHIGTFVDQLLLFCFHYDPTTGRYTRVALAAVRAGGLVTLLVLAGTIAWWVRRERAGGAAA